MCGIVYIVNQIHIQKCMSPRLKVRSNKFAACESSNIGVLNE